MWALMPILRYLSMGVARATLNYRSNSVVCFVCKRALSESSRLTVRRVARCIRSEPEMRERLVRFRHAVDFLALLHRTAPVFGGFEQLGREARAHRLLAAFSCRLAQPAHRERHAANGTHLDRHLEVRA